MNFVFKKAILHRVSAIVAGGFVPYAFAPHGFYLLAILALAILFYCWSTASSPRVAFILGYLFGLAMFGIGVNWLHISINLFGGVNIIGALLLTYLLVAFISLYPAVCGYLLVRYIKKRYYLMTLPSLWLITEWCRGWFFSGFPWLNIGTSQTDSPLASFAPLLGDYGVGFIGCLSASALVYLICGKAQERIISLVLLIIISCSCLFLKDKNWTKENGNTLMVALIQGAVAQELKWKPEQRQKTYALYAGLSEPYWSFDLIIWPETAIPSSYHFADDFIVPISAKKETSNALFMSGLVYKDQASNEYFNSVLLMDKQHHFYHKHHLVPFGEYLPFKSILGIFLGFLKIPMSDFSAGEPEQKNFVTDKGILGMSICYEVVYGNEIRRALPAANVLVNVSNDAWFADSIAPHQHLQIARMRALENGRYLLRSTNTGISAIIDNRGKVVAHLPQFKPHVLSATVKMFEGATPYSQYGNKGILLIGFLSLLISLLLGRYRYPVA